jgi:hypothetical protein
MKSYLENSSEFASNNGLCARVSGKFQVKKVTAKMLLMQYLKYLSMLMMLPDIEDQT